MLSALYWRKQENPQLCDITSLPPSLVMFYNHNTKCIMRKCYTLSPLLLHFIGFHLQEGKEMTAQWCLVIAKCWRVEEGCRGDVCYMHQLSHILPAKSITFKFTLEIIWVKLFEDCKSVTFKNSIN